MDIYLDSDFIAISVEGDSENITRGLHPAEKLLFSSVNREVTSHKHSGGKKELFLDASKSLCTQFLVLTRANVSCIGAGMLHIH